MEQLSSLLPSVLARRGLKVPAHAAHVTHCAQQWLNERLPMLRTAISVEKFHEGTLFIACTHSIATQECRGVFADLEKFLYNDCRFGDIKGIRVSRN